MPISIALSLPPACVEMNQREPKMPNMRNTAYMHSARNMPLPAILLAFSLSLSPSDRESMAFMPMPVPTPIAIIRS